MILCCGEALIDMLPRESREGEPAFAPYPGGAVFNTAIALGRLGAPAGFFSGVSTDLFGQMLTRALADSGVDTAHLALSGAPTTLAFVQLTGGQASYAFYDEGTAGRMLSASDLPSLGPDTEALFFGGISLVSEPCGSTYEALMTREAETRTIMIDPNIRPGFITDEDAYRARIGRMLNMSDIVKISDEDLHWLQGEGADPESLLSQGRTSVVLMTRGAQGVTLLTRHGRTDVPAQKAEVADTVGAGDTFNAGFMAGLHRDGLLHRAALASASPAELTAAARLGTAAAAVTVSRAGANPPWAHELPKGA